MKRQWKNCEISVFVYIFQYDRGVMMLYVNFSDFTYEENVEFLTGNKLKLENL